MAQFNFVTHPSRLIKEYMETRSIGCKDAAELAGIEKEDFKTVLDKNNHLNATQIDWLGDVFPDTPLQFWEDLQDNFDKYENDNTVSKMY